MNENAIDKTKVGGGFGISVGSGGKPKEFVIPIIHLREKVEVGPLICEYCVKEGGICGELAMNFIPRGKSGLRLCEKHCKELAAKT